VTYPVVAILDTDALVNQPSTAIHAPRAATAVALKNTYQNLKWLLDAERQDIE
jgi:hypothetical protein